jgi:hypothetical protein
MTTLKSVFADIDLTKAVLLCVAFIGLNILDARLTEVAVRLGSYELNPLYGARFASSIAFKGLISAALVLTLVIFKRGALLKPLNLGMLLICAWNGLAIWSWCVGSS